MVNIRSEIWRRSLWKATFLCSTIHVEFSWYALKYAQIKNMFPWIKYLQNVFVFLFSLLLFHLHEQILLSSVTFTIFPCFSAVAISDSHISRGRSLTPFYRNLFGISLLHNRLEPSRIDAHILKIKLLEQIWLSITAIPC